ncbi:MAG: S46 family peptidase [Pseudomonadota bacterium]
MKASRAWLAAMLLLPLSVFAAEGMWTLDNLPTKAIQKSTGFAPDAAWVTKVMQSSARLGNGCSGSFVSKDGLVLTNHHCARGCIQELSSAKADYIADGFLAKARADELRCPALEINRLEEISDVTAKVEAATKGTTGEAFAKARKAEIASIESACTGEAKATKKCEVVTLYQGGRYHLYRYHRFDDVRLSFAPEQAIAFFGGDPDNFNFPRFNLDMALLRVYENGKPATVASYFPFKPEGAKEGEASFITGHPGNTERGLTVAQLETLRDLALPQRLMFSSEFRGYLTRYSAEGAEQARVAQDDLFGVENSLKARKGQLEALQDPTVFAYKKQQEDELRAAVAKNPKLKKDTGKAWQDIAKAQGVLRNIYWEHRMLESGSGFYSKYFDSARLLLRGADERAKPNAERLQEFGEARLPQLEQHLFSTAPIYPEYEKATLAFSLTKLREYLSPDHPMVKAVLGKDSPETVAKRLIEGTKLGDLETRKALWNGGAKAVAASSDPFIELARKVDVAARALRKTYEDEVKAIETQSAAKIAAARFATKGTSVYPDATFTLRLSYGEVKGWEEKGKPVAPFTTIGGAFERETGADPFALPKSWFKARDKGGLTLAQPFNFVSTNDIIGGNSGSPVINKNAEIIGLVFDGNIRSLGGAYWYDERSNRAVSVHAGAIVEALRKVYDAGFLADEIAGR